METAARKSEHLELQDYWSVEQNSLSGILTEKLNTEGGEEEDRHKPSFKNRPKSITTWSNTASAKLPAGFLAFTS